jgi:hypothetical protein
MFLRRRHTPSVQFDFFRTRGAPIPASIISRRKEERKEKSQTARRKWRRGGKSIWFKSCLHPNPRRLLTSPLPKGQFCIRGAQVSLLEMLKPSLIGQVCWTIGFPVFSWNPVRLGDLCVHDRFQLTDLFLRRLLCQNIFTRVLATIRIL